MFVCFALLCFARLGSARLGDRPLLSFNGHRVLCPLADAIKSFTQHPVLSVLSGMGLGDRAQKTRPFSGGYVP